jgi:hypothetical protein
MLLLVIAPLEDAFGLGLLELGGFLRRRAARGHANQE